MKKTNSSTIIAVAAIAVFVIGGLYLMMGRGGAPAPQTDTMHGGSAVAPGNINDLIGKPSPPFSLRDRNGVEYSSENLKGKNVILFFNEGLMCYPSCWNQIVALSQDQRFQRPDIAALSVVTDNPDDWQQAIQKMPELGYAKTLFDTDRTASRAFGTLTTNSSMHYGSLPGHSYVLIDKEGIVRYVYDDPRMAVNNDLIAAELARIK